MHRLSLNNLICKLLAFLTCLCFIVTSPASLQAQRQRNSKSNAKTSISQKPQTSAEAKKRQEEAQKEIRLTEQQLRENETNVRQNLAQLGKLEESISETNKVISNLNTKISRLNNEISSLESGIEKNENDLQYIRSEYLKAVKKMRVTKKNKSTLTFLFSSNSLSQAMRRMRYLREFSNWRERQTEEINNKTKELKEQRDELAKAKEEHSNALVLQKRNINKLAEQHSRQETLVNELKKNGAALQSHLKRKQEEATELGHMVSVLIAEEQRKAEQERIQKQKQEEAKRRAEEEERQRLLADQTVKSGKTNKSKKEKKEELSSSKNTDYASARKREPRGNKDVASSAAVNQTVDVKKNSSFADMRGKLPYPTSGSFTITSNFGRQTLPELPDVEYNNPGIDAESDAGASARAVYEGKVSGVYILPGYNTVVIINHGNYYTVYGNISSPSVKVGDEVVGGTTLGKLMVNDDDPAHSSIHFEVWMNREKLNPREWLN